MQNFRNKLPRMPTMRRPNFRLPKTNILLYLNNRPKLTAYIVVWCLMVLFIGLVGGLTEKPVMYRRNTIEAANAFTCLYAFTIVPFFTYHLQACVKESDQIPVAAAMFSLTFMILLLTCVHTDKLNLYNRGQQNASIVLMMLLDFAMLLIFMYILIAGGCKGKTIMGMVALGLLCAFLVVHIGVLGAALKENIEIQYGMTVIV
jgi:hypothetical protein